MSNEQNETPSLGAVAIVFLVFAVGFIVAGFETMLTYDSGYGSQDKIVGGDAYNYIIRAVRGVGWICAGVASAVTANVLAALSN